MESSLGIRRCSQIKMGNNCSKLYKFTEIISWKCLHYSELADSFDSDSDNENDIWLSDCYNSTEIVTVSESGSD